MKELFVKYFEGRATKQEQEHILVLLKENKENQMAFDKAKEDWKQHSNKQVSLLAWNSWKQIERTVNPQFLSIKSMPISIKYLAVCIILLLGIALYTLSIGYRNQLVSIHSGAGQLTEVYLPDSTQVFINSSSDIIYKTSLFGLHREVILDGEAFFDVSKKQFGSFDVIANKIKAHVTGTRFNVKAYRGEDISIVLEEGHVEVVNMDQSLHKAYMKPGEMIVCDMSTNKFRRSKINVSEYTSWKEGILYFENNKLPDLTKVLERRYGVKFAEISDPILKELTLTVTIRDERLNKVTQLMASALPIKIETKNQIIYISLDRYKYEKIK